MLKMIFNSFYITIRCAHQGIIGVHMGPLLKHMINIRRQEELLYTVDLKSFSTHACLVKQNINHDLCIFYRKVELFL